jgi:hypothetical protein
MKFAAVRPYTDPEVAARKLVEIANSVEAVQDGRIHIELLNGPLLFEHKATPAEYTAGLTQAIDRGWLQMHESGTYVKFTQLCRAVRMTTCPQCEGCGWVCERLTEKPWEGPHACPCGAPGAPCPACNATNDGAAPRMPEGFKTDVDKDGVGLRLFPSPSCCRTARS